MSANTRTPYYISIWGDTVDFRECLIALLIGIVFGVVCGDGAFSYLKAYHADMSKGALMGTALMIGAGGSILAGYICAKLFKPKRIIEEESQRIEIEELVSDLELDMHGEAEILKQASPEIIAELKILNLYDLFAYEGHVASSPRSNASH